MKYSKYHAIGNDYIVIRPTDLQGELSPELNIEIWERGAGYTLASGTSSTAAAAVAYKLGHCSHDILVHMPGGRIHIQFSNGFFATMTGPVTKVCEGVMAREMFEADFWL